MGLKDTITRVGTKAADKVAKLASLSPEQLEKVQADREKYLSEMPDPTDSTAKEQTERLLAACSVEIYKEYLAHLQEFYVPVEAQAEYDGRPFDAARNICFVNITKWVVDKNENSLEKLVNVYEVLSNEECNIALIFHRTCETTHVTLAVTNTKNDDNNVEARSFRDRLAAAVRGNFPGAELAQTDGAGIPPCLKQDGPRSVAIASNVPGEKSEKFLSQTIEKLIDGIVPESRSREYVLILMATPILDVETRKLNLQEYYSALAPYASWTTNFTYDEHSATGSSATVGVNVGASAGVQNGTNQSYTDTSGTADTTGSSFSESTSSSVTDTTGTTDTSGTTYTEGTSSSVAEEESLTKTKGLSYIGTVTRAKGTSTSTTTGTSASEAVTSSVAKSVSQSVASTAGNAVTQSLSKAVSNSLSRTAGIFKSVSTGVNFGASFARSSTVTATIGKSEGIQQTFTNYNIKHALEILEQQMKRLELSTALGLWDFAAYVMSEDHITAGNVAHTYLALTQGEESYMSQASVNIWRGDTGENGGRAAEICRYLQQLRHPVFGLDPGLTGEEEELKSYPPAAAATTSLSGKELAYALNFPQKSISGLPVIECAGFGRNVTTYDPVHADSTPFALGQVFHMLREERTAVDLAADSLTAHTFITGSTGSGKSNTIYQILNEALANDVRFLVIEPAKGEYKQVFGMEESVSVYGTNPALTPLLRLNPFSFPKQIHILEHLDRLVEIFNVCWPMYAAMPAVLKRAVEQSYIDSG